MKRSYNEHSLDSTELIIVDPQIKRSYADISTSSSEQDLSMNILSDIKNLVTTNDYFGEIGKAVEVLIPTVVIVGDQSAGKSAIINRIIKKLNSNTFSLKMGSNEMTTKCPFEIRFVHKRPDMMNYISIKGKIQSFEKSQDMIEYSHLNPSNDMLMVCNIVIPRKHEEFIIVDLPGLIKNGDTKQCEYFAQLTGKYVTSSNCIMLHVINYSDDISNCTSLELFHNQREKIQAQHFVVASKIDRPSNIKAIRANDATVRNIFPDTEIYYTIAANENGLISSDVEMKILKIRFNGLNDHTGIDILVGRIPEILKNFITQKIPKLVFKIKNLSSICDQILTTVGHQPRNIYDVIHSVSNQLNEIITKELKTDKIKINTYTDVKYLEIKNNLDITFKNVNDTDISSILHESISSRGESLRATVSLDRPIKKMIGKSQSYIDKHFKKFSNGLQTILEKILEETLNRVGTDNPTSIELLGKIREEWTSQINILIEKYNKKCLQYSDTLCNNPADYASTSIHFNIVSMCYDMYKESNSSNNYHLNISVNSFEDWLKQNRNIFNDNINAKIVKKYFYDYFFDNGAIDKYMTYLDSTTKRLTHILTKNLLGSYLTQLITENRTLIRETEEISRKRRITLRVLSLCKQFKSF